MNIKRISLFAAAGITALAGVFLANNPEKEHYFPRSIESSLKSDQLHAGYVEYMKSIRNNRETGSISPADVQAANFQASKLQQGNKALNLNWRFKGPDNVGGRTRALLIDRNDTNHIYAGSVSGGLWESFDAARSWQPYDDSFTVSAISCIDQGSDGTVYVGTGSGFEGNNNNKALGSDFVGSGLYKLTGNGNYQKLVGPALDLVYGPDWSTINRIAVDPNNSQRLIVAMNSGLRESLDGGLTWSNPLGNILTEAEDVKITPDGKVLASISSTNNLTRSTIYASTDNGATFNQTVFNNARRIELAISPSNTNIMYASMATRNGCLFGVYKSIDAGLTWTVLQNTPNYFQSLGCQGNYDNAIAVYPNDPNRIVVAGVSMFSWRQSSVDPAPVQGEWKSIALTNEFNVNGSRNFFYVHADKHALVFHPTNPNKLYIGSDGGVGFSGNFQNEFPFYGQYNIGYNVTQFYDIGVSPKDLVLAGAQDNGTQLIGMSFNTGKSATEVKGGDGFDSELFTINPSLGLASYVFGDVTRVQGIGTTLSNSTFNNADITSGKLAALCGANNFCSAPFYTAFAKWESFNSIETNDSVLVIIDRTDLPPILNGTIIPFKSKNNSIPLQDTLTADLFPVDTLFSDVAFLDTLEIGFGVDGKATFTTAFDVIAVDTIAKTLTFNYRGQAQEVRSFTFGVKEDYTNIFYSRGPLSVTVNKTEAVYIEPNIEFKYNVEFPDVVQSYVALLNVKGNLSDNERNIWISKDIQKGGNVNEPKWIKIAGTGSFARRMPDTAKVPTPTANPQNNFFPNALCATFSNDGNSLFYGNSEGDLYRIDNINDIDVSTFGPLTPDEFAVDKITVHNKIRDFGNRAVTSVAIDPQNSNNIVVTLGNYNQARYVYRSTNALATSPQFDIISGGGGNGLPNAPVYEAIIDFSNNNRVLVATEIGVFGTENAFETNTIVDNGITIPDVIWTEENVGLGRVPVHSMTQMTFNWEQGAINQGKVYIGTHGRGVFESDKFVGINDLGTITSKSKDLKNELKVYPNPTISNLNVELILHSNKSVVIEIFSITGQKVSTQNISNTIVGTNTVNLDLKELNRGTYFIRAIQNGQVTTSKFLKQ